MYLKHMFSVLFLVGLSFVACKPKDQGGDANSPDKAQASVNNSPSNKPQDLILGTWEMDTKAMEKAYVAEMEVPAEEAPQAVSEHKGSILEFKKDGSLNQTGGTKPPSKSEWTLSPDGKTLTIKVEGGSVELDVEELSQKRLVVHDGKMFIYWILNRKS